MDSDKGATSRPQSTGNKNWARVELQRVAAFLRCVLNVMAPEQYLTTVVGITDTEPGLVHRGSLSRNPPPLPKKDVFPSRRTLGTSGTREVQHASSYRMFNPFTPKSDQCQISPAGVNRNITSHSMKNLAFHSLFRWNMIILRILATSLIHFALKDGENVLFELGS